MQFGNSNSYSDGIGVSKKLNNLEIYELKSGNLAANRGSSAI